MTTNDDNKLVQATALTAGNADDIQQHKDAFVSRQVQILYDNVGVALLGTLAGASFIAYFFIGVANTRYLLTWYGIMLLLTLLRFSLLLSYRRGISSQNDRNWLTAFEVSTALSGVVWGASTLLLFPDTSFIHLVILAFVIGGMSAGTLATYPVSRYAPSIFSITSITPLVISLHLSTNEIAGPVEFLTIAFLVSMLVFARRQFTIAQDAISLGLQNRGLVKYLSDVWQETSLLNGKLREEINSRCEAEEQLLKNEKRFRVLSDAAFEGILVHDCGTILDVNRAITEMSSYTREDIIGTNILDFVAPEYREAARSRLLQPTDESSEIYVLKKNGDRFPVEIAGRNIDYLGRDARVVVIRDLTKTRDAERSLTLSEQRISRYIQHTLIAVIEWDVDFRVSEWNPAAEKIFGYSKDEALGSYAHDLILSESDREAARAVWSHLVKDKQPSVFTHKNITKQGRHIICEWDATPVIDDNGNVIGVVSLAHDVTERVDAEKALFREKELAEVTLSSLGDGVITTNDSGEIDYINPAAEVMIGWMLDEAHGKPVGDVFIIQNEKTGEYYDGLAELAMSDNTRNLSTRHTVLKQRSGAEVPVVFTGSPLRNYKQKVIGAVIVFRDVSELRQLENKLTYEASHDSLTGLINRREFESRLTSALETVANEEAQHALLYLDLDQFKVVNDTCGHIAGDELLIQLTQQLREKVRDIDSLARLGGDEFGILLDHCPLDMAEEIAQSICKLFAEFHFTWEEKTFDTGVSIGVVPIDLTSGSMAEVMSSADTACYVAKEQGRNRVHVYREDDTEVAQRHGEMQWVHRIRDAIEADRIVLYAQKIQPLSNSDTGNEHYEVLMRMLDTDDSIIPPMAFIPAAERYDMMKQLDRHIIKKAIRQKVQLAEKAGKHIDFSINLSGQSLCSHDFLDFIVDEIMESGISPEELCFEVTETAAIGNLIHAKRFISILRGMGCSFSLDDFGSGLSSFGYLKNLDVNYLKIDGSFVRDMARDKVDEAMVKSIHQVGRVLNMKTIAEFVENDETIERLRNIGVNYAQGYGIEKPRPIEELME